MATVGSVTSVYSVVDGKYNSITIIYASLTKEWINILPKSLPPPCFNLTLGTSIYPNMELSLLDISIITVLMIIYIIVGIRSSKRSGNSSKDFFLSGGKMPWWLLGVSMVATTFSADTPNLVTDIVRQNGVSGNWAWWAFLLTGMLTVFVYARLWRRSGIMTDLEFYEIRYSGKSASFLRGFRAIYLGVFFNIMIMATVSLAAIKIGGVILGLEPWVILAVAGTVTVLYSALGGLRAVITHRLHPIHHRHHRGDMGRLYCGESA